MPKFSKTSLDRLGTCHRDLQTLFEEVIRNFDCTIICGHRNEADQNDAFARGASKLKWPMGKHNSMPSLAVDVMGYPLNWEDTKGNYFFAGAVIATAKKLYEEGRMTHKVRWGAAWDGTLNKKGTFTDVPHFELIKN